MTSQSFVRSQFRSANELLVSGQSRSANEHLIRSVSSPSQSMSSLLLGQSRSVTGQPKSFWSPVSPGQSMSFWSPVIHRSVNELRLRSVSVSHRSVNELLVSGQSRSVTGHSYLVKYRTDRKLPCLVGDASGLLGYFRDSAKYQTDRKLPCLQCLVEDASGLQRLCQVPD